MNKMLKKYTALGLTGLILVLAISSFFLHNHPISFEEPSSCPAHIFQITITSALIIFLMLSLLFIDETEIKSIFYQKYIPRNSHYNKIAGRSPPKKY